MNLTDGRPAALENLRETAERATRAQRDVAWAVSQARRAGATWQQVADVFGITRQSAQERFGENR